MSPVETLPILSGLLLGALLGWMEPASRKRIGLPAALVLSFIATVLSGEYRVSWGFLLVDMSLVVVAGFASLVTIQRLRWSWGMITSERRLRSGPRILLAEMRSN